MNRRSARRRTRTALLLCIFGAAGMGLMSLLSSLIGGGAAPWFSAAGTLLFYAVPAWLGLFVLDGDQSALLERRRLSGAQAMWAAVCGALLVSPSLLVSNVIAAVAHIFGAAAAPVQAVPDESLLMPMLLGSGLLAPVCEELFFRGYLQGVFSRSVGRGRGALLAALAFAFAHGVSGETAVYVLLGLLFSAVGYRMHSILAPVMMHMMYNITLILLAFRGMGGVLSQLTIFYGLLMLIGCGFFVYALGRAWKAESVHALMLIPRSVKMTALRTIALLLLAVIAAQLAPAAFERLFAWLTKLAEEAELAKAAQEAAKAAMEVIP